MDRERRIVEREMNQVVADASSPLAQMHVRESMKKNKFTMVLYALALFAPAFCLASFYASKMQEIRSQFRDPYALPEGFDPNTESVKRSTKDLDAGAQVPKSLVLGAKPGSSRETAPK
ncbi:hypothetical protein STCU_01304 [Strigomonas culicis]|uniref:Transmembrane protein n=1 Tax=Strigomonas culicis TaxID=28005 RepID=S9V1B2_9TRYP|nr:hypothetical protein STCU_01304 [Strigomonas culicis]|eukprot:EPY34798.1 hypothetical protein STCU_01304 [Strigomonas culicis]